MELIKKTLTLYILLFGISNFINAQETYRAEIGLQGGGAFYLGDANKQLFANTQPMYGFLYRQKFNQRIALQVNALVSNVMATGTVPTFGTLSFENKINSIDGALEFNFFDLEKKSYNPFSRIFSPYIFAGAGMMNYVYSGVERFKPSYNAGLGMKFLLGDRWGLNLQWTNRLLLTDQMEGLPAFNNYLDMNGSNLLNNDILSTISLAITFNIWKDKCNCRNSHY